MTAYYQILTFGPAPKTTTFRSEYRALRAAKAWKQSAKGCGSTIRVVEFSNPKTAKAASISNYPSLGGRLIACY